MKKIFKLGFLIVCFLCFCLYLSNKFIYKEKSDYNTDNKINMDKYIDSIINYTDNSVDKDFLLWILEEYGVDIILKLEDNFKDNYSITDWRNILGESYYVLLDRYNNLINDNPNIRLTDKGNNRLSFVGDVSLADNWYIMPKYDERKKGIYGILSEDVVDIIRDSSVMIANNEFTISNRGEKLANKFYTFRGSPERLSIYDEMGVDLVTLANNHVYDFGEDAFYDTLNSLREYNMPYIGAGKNIDEAMEPYYFIVNGYKIGFVNATRAEKYVLTPGASSDNPGVFRCYDPTNLYKVIEETKKNSDFVIALIHYGKEDSTELESVQIEISKRSIDFGADLIVGTHAHTLQGIEFYKGKAIIYNLGDFIFNNETKDTAIFQVEISDDGSFKYYFIPCKESNEYTYLLNDNEKIRVLNYMKNLSPNVIFEDSGIFYSR